MIVIKNILCVIEKELNLGLQTAYWKMYPVAREQSGSRLHYQERIFINIQVLIIEHRYLELLSSVIEMLM